MERRLDHLDGLRGILAWWVVAGHIGHTVGSGSYLLLSNGLAVDVFIILSGFVIYRLLDLKQEPYGAYIARRAFRLFPAYLPVLIISALMLPIFAEASQTAPIVTERTILRAEQAELAMRDLAPHFTAHLVLAQGVVPNAVLPASAYTIVGQAWSVSMEWQFYLLAPAVLFAVERRRFALLALCATTLILSAPMIGAGFVGAKAHLFGIGIATYLFLRDRRPGAIAAITIFAAVGLAIDGPEQLIPLALWLAALSPLQRVLTWQPLVWLGDRTYSVYLIHMIPIYAAAWLAPPGHFVVVVTIVAVAGTALLSEASFRFIEKPGMALGKALATSVRHRNVQLSRVDVD